MKKQRTVDFKILNSRSSIFRTFKVLEIRGINSTLLRIKGILQQKAKRKSSS